MKQHANKSIECGRARDAGTERSFAVVRICFVFSLVFHATLLSTDYRRQSTSRLLHEPIEVQIRQLVSIKQLSEANPDTLQPQQGPQRMFVQRAIAPRSLGPVATSSLFREDGFLAPGDRHVLPSPSPGVITESKGQGIAGMPPANSGTSTSALGKGSGPQSVRCISSCTPSYPVALNGAEGNARVMVSINSTGDVTGVVLTGGPNNPALTRLAMRAAARMRFSVPEGFGSVTVPVNIFYTIRGTAFDRDTATRIKRVVRVQKRSEALPPSPSQVVPRANTASSPPNDNP